MNLYRAAGTTKHAECVIDQLINKCKYVNEWYCTYVNVDINCTLLCLLCESCVHRKACEDICNIYCNCL